MQDTGVQLSTISSIPSVFKYKYSGSDIVADGKYLLLFGSHSFTFCLKIADRSPTQLLTTSLPRPQQLALKNTKS